MVGNACLSAARALRGQVAAAVARRWEIAAGGVSLVGRQAIDLADPARRVPIAEAFQWAEADHGLLAAAGSYDTPRDRHGSYRGGTIGASPAYSFTAHVAEVAVDVETGEVEVIAVWAAHDCGKALSPRIVEGQIEGSVAMGLGEALLEEHLIDAARGGVHAGPSLLDYKLATALDLPPIHAILVEHPDARGPYGAKEAGEGPLHPIIPAVANAIFDAVGVRLRSTPFSPPRVLAALDARARRLREEVA
jgi:CO/xanthine dehydrogenase Mo-binding subunit